MFLSAIPPNAPVLVVVVTQDGCGHCDEYLPRFARIAHAYPDVPMINLDAADERAEAQAFMDQFGLDATPMTYILRHNARGGGVWKIDGAVEDAQIAAALEFARGMTR